jgi:hypothetical protein
MVAGLAGPVASRTPVPFAASGPSAARLGESTLARRSSRAASGLLRRRPAPMPGSMDAMPGAPPPPVGGYDPAGRRDPFAPVLSQRPRQLIRRFLLTTSWADRYESDCHCWGAYYYRDGSDPDGNGIPSQAHWVGPNAGVVSAVTERALSCRAIHRRLRQKTGARVRQASIRKRA